MLNKSRKIRFGNTSEGCYTCARPSWVKKNIVFQGQYATVHRDCRQDKMNNCELVATPNIHCHDLMELQLGYFQKFYSETVDCLKQYGATGHQMRLNCGDFARHDHLHVHIVVESQVYTKIVQSALQ